MAELPADVLDLERPSETDAVLQALPPFDNEASWQGISATTRAIVEFDAAREIVSGYLARACETNRLIEELKKHELFTEGKIAELDHISTLNTSHESTLFLHRHKMSYKDFNIDEFLASAKDAGTYILNENAKLRKLTAELNVLRKPAGSAGDASK